MPKHTVWVWVAVLQIIIIIPRQTKSGFFFLFVSAFLRHPHASNHYYCRNPPIATITTPRSTTTSTTVAACKNTSLRENAAQDDRTNVTTIMASPPSFTNRLQTTILHAFWTVMTRIGMRRLGNVLKRWYPAAYKDSIFYFPAGKGCVALTIDDGLFRPNDDNNLQQRSQSSLANHHHHQQQQQQTPMIQQVCDLLRLHQAHATFFVCTNYTTPAQAQQVLRDGHELGNHLERDVSGYYCNLNQQEFAAVLDETNAVLQSMMTTTLDGDDNDNDDGNPDANPRERIQWFRAPQGLMSSAMCRALADRHMTNIMGDCYCDDWAFAEKMNSTTGVVAPIMLRQVQEGSIAIFHMPQNSFRSATLDALAEFLQGLQERNLRCVTVSEMMQNQLKE